MGLDTRSNASLWKDFAMVELNYAVLYSFQVMNSTFFSILYHASQLLPWIQFSGFFRNIEIELESEA